MSAHHQNHAGPSHHAHMAADFRKRFWIALILTLPVLALSPMLQELAGLREVVRFSGDVYVLFGLSSAVFWYGGWPFLTGLVREVRSRKPGMMTLVAVAITTAYGYSSAVVFGLTGKMFFWERVTLVDIMLLGHWIEMRSVMGASKALDGPQGEVRFEGQQAGAPHAGPLLELATVLPGCNNAHLVEEGGTWKTVGDPTEGALLAAGAQAGGDRARIEQELPKQHAIPFDSDRKRSAVIRRMPDGTLRALVNGAPGGLLERCTHLDTSTGIRPLTDEDRERVVTRTSAMATQALRVLGSAFRDLDNASSADLTADAVEHDLVFVGLTGMYDPPRPEGKGGHQASGGHDHHR